MKREEWLFYSFTSRRGLWTAVYAMAKTDGAMSAYVDMQYLLELKRALYVYMCPSQYYGSFSHAGPVEQTICVKRVGGQWNSGKRAKETKLCIAWQSRRKSERNQIAFDKRRRSQQERAHIWD